MLSFGSHSTASALAQKTVLVINNTSAHTADIPNEKREDANACC